MPVKALPLAANCWAGEFQGPHAGAYFAGSTYRPVRTDTAGIIFPVVIPSLSQTNSGPGVGVNVGYDVQCGHRVFGVEADWTFGHVTSAPYLGLFPITFIPGSTASATSVMKGYGTLRTRAGIVSDNLLLYATGGLAYGRFETTYRLDVPGLGGLSESVNEGRVGWTAGFGAEYAVRPGWHLRAEALYLDFADRTRNPDNLGFPSTVTHSDSIWTARLGLSAKLDPHRGTADAAGDARASAGPSFEGRFQGFYVGGHVGFASLSSAPSDRDLFLTVPAEPGSGIGAIGGVQAGYNVQRGRAVFGVEADWSFGTVKNDLRFAYYIPDSDLRTSNELKGFGTVRGRAGLAADDLLIYLTGGAAVARTKTIYAVVPPPIPGEVLSNSATRWGWTAGFGAEWAVSDRVSVKGEALYVGLKDHAWTADSVFQGPQRFNSSDSFWTARLGVNVKLGTERRTPAEVVEAARCGTGRFQGAYVGGQGSYTSYHANRVDSDLYFFGTGFPPPSFQQVDAGYGGGVQGGYNIQCGDKVFGAEADWSFGKQKSATNIDFAFIPIGSVTSSIQNFSTLRGRAGVALDNLLLYVTAGAARAKIHTEWALDIGGVFNETLAFDKWRLGWTVGFGTEWAVMPNISVKSEVLYADFGQSVVSAFSPLIGDTQHFTHSDAVWAARMGVNVKLN
jgi:outer membrane immunogenic protein